MKKILITGVLVMSSFILMAQDNFKTETTLLSNGKLLKTITICKESMNGTGVNLLANIIENDTSYYFIYKDLRYTHITSYQHTNNMSLIELNKLLVGAKMIRNKEIDNFSNGDGIYLSEISWGSMGNVIFQGKLGWNFLNINKIESKLTEFNN
jgi:hypothetical protein